VFPAKSGQRRPPGFDWAAYAARNRVERTVGRPVRRRYAR